MGTIYNYNYDYEDYLYVIDRELPNGTFQCWLVHSDLISYHLGLPMEQINQAVDTQHSVISSQGDVYVAVQFIDNTNWNNLIQGHPEIANDGVTCYKRYSTVGQQNLGPRDFTLTFYSFLTTFC